MSKHIVNDGWVLLRDPRLVSERSRRPIIAKMTTMQAVAEKVTGEGTTVDEAEFNALYAFNDLVAIALIKEWSWDVPVTIDGLLDLPAADYDAILKITAPLVSELMPSFSPDGANDPESPTVPSVE
jgi:hypothetical protein